MKDRKLFLPSIADIFFLSIFFYLAFSAGNGLLSDADTGYHIRAGEYIIETLSIPRHDIFSFLSPPPKWTAHEWLSEVIMAMIHKASGLSGVVVFFALMIAGTYYLLFKVVYKGSKNILLSLIIVFFAIASSTIHWLARPHIFTMLFLVVWYWVLDSYQYRDRNYLYLLPLIMLLWVNLHGGFIIGLITTGVYIMGNLLQGFFAGRDEKSAHMKKAKVFGVVIGVCAAIALINPYGYHIFLFPFKLRADKFIMDNIYEFFSPNFHEVLIFKYLLFFMIVVFAVSKTRPNLIELVLVLLFANMALYSGRHITLFAIIASPILLRQSESILENTGGRFVEFFKNKAEGIAKADALAMGGLWPFLGIVAVVVMLAIGRIEYGFDRKTKPVDAVEFLMKEPIKGNMFNNDEFGDYIIYAAWPRYRVLWDGRADMYGSDRMKEYLKIMRIQIGWEDVMKRYDISWVVHYSNSPLSMLLMERKDWHLIYADKVANIFVKNIPENRHLIEKYPNVKLTVDE